MDTNQAGTTRPFNEATRTITGLLAPLEKRTLLWLARRLPRWVNSDHLTLLALAAMAGAGISFRLASRTPLALFAVAAFLAVNWFGDSLDGTVARVRRQQRPRYGFYVDHVVDLIGTACLFGGMAASGMMSPLVAVGLLASYVLLAAETFLAAHSLGEFTLSYFKMGPTELRILLAVGAVTLVWHPRAEIAGRTFWLLDVGGVVGIAGMIGTFLFAAATHTRALYVDEPMPAPQGEEISASAAAVPDSAPLQAA
jgi:phosphatidylglycerophosphate synthase